MVDETRVLPLLRSLTDDLSAMGWGPPSDNGDAFVLLGRHGVLDAALSQRMRRAAGFRNVLVHEYVRVDDEIVMQRMRDPSDLEDFARQVSDWLAAHPGA